MAKYCRNCGKEIDADSLFCTYCGARIGSHGVEAVLSEPSGSQYKKRSLRTLFLALGAIATLTILAFILNENLLLPWQRGARRNKQIILAYANIHYPNAKIIDKEFNSAKLFVWNNFRDCIVFVWDDVEFGITAEGGEILIDGYCGARAILQFDKIIQDGFLKPRGITAYTDYQFSDNYYEIYPYTGGLGVRITVWDQGSTPREVGWLYDFYSYWRKEADFLTKYVVRIDIVANDEVVNHINYSDESYFFNEGAFYSAFKEGH